MNKSKTFYDFCKISVDDAELINGEYICYCITNGTPDDVEHTALTRVIPMAELKQFIAPKGMVEVECKSDPADTDKVTFAEWLSTQTTKDLFPHFNDIINKAEHRVFDYGNPPLDITLINCIETCGYKIIASDYYVPARDNYIKWEKEGYAISFNGDSNAIAGIVGDNADIIFILKIAGCTDIKLFGLLVSLDFVSPNTIYSQSHAA